MPTSDAENKDWARDIVTALNPRTVVDIGPGEGTYSDLLRGSLPDSRFLCIEAWGPYITEYDLWGKYNHVVVGDIRHTDLHSVEYAPNLVIIGDVLEHMLKDEARSTLKRLQAWADAVLVCVPIVHHEQAAFDGNWFEIHRDHWAADEVRAELGAGVVDEKVGRVLAYFLWSRGSA